MSKTYVGDSRCYIFGSNGFEINETKFPDVLMSIAATFGGIAAKMQPGTKPRETYARMESELTSFVRKFYPLMFQEQAKLEEPADNEDWEEDEE